MTVASPPAATRFVELCVCVRCGGAMESTTHDAIVCIVCEASYPIVNGVLHLLPTYDEESRERYLSNYNAIAKADLEQPFEQNREARHSTLLHFIGDVRGMRVLDIGSSDAGYLRRLDAAELIAVDLAAPFLEAIPEAAGIVRICTDAELLPLKPGTFDVVVIADVMEHLLTPEQLVQRLTGLIDDSTRVIVHVPWQEDIRKYDDSHWEFTHLRSFSYYTFSRLWSNFRIVRERGSYPALEEPFVFALRRYLPLPIYNLLSWAYFHRGYSKREYELRARWIEELPSRERWLLKIYQPLFRMFELRLLESKRSSGGGFSAPIPKIDFRPFRIRSRRKG